MAEQVSSDSDSWDSWYDDDGELQLSVAVPPSVERWQLSDVYNLFQARKDKYNNLRDRIAGQLSPGVNRTAEEVKLLAEEVTELARGVNEIGGTIGTPAIPCRWATVDVKELTEKVNQLLDVLLLLSQGLDKPAQEFNLPDKILLSAKEARLARQSEQGVNEPMDWVKEPENEEVKLPPVPEKKCGFGRWPSLYSRCCDRDFLVLASRDLKAYSQVCWEFNSLFKAHGRQTVIQTLLEDAVLRDALAIYPPFTDDRFWTIVFQDLEVLSLMSQAKHHLDEVFDNVPECLYIVNETASELRFWYNYEYTFWSCMRFDKHKWIPVADCFDSLAPPSVTILHRGRSLAHKLKQMNIIENLEDLKTDTRHRYFHLTTSGRGYLPTSVMTNQAMSKPGIHESDPKKFKLSPEDFRFLYGANNDIPASLLFTISRTFAFAHKDPVDPHDFTRTEFIDSSFKNIVEKGLKEGTEMKRLRANLLELRIEKKPNE